MFSVQKSELPYVGCYASWSQCMRKSERGLPMNRLTLPGRVGVSQPK
jgi:hypothetical protein